MAIRLATGEAVFLIWDQNKGKFTQRYYAIFHERLILLNLFWQLINVNLAWISIWRTLENGSNWNMLLVWSQLFSSIIILKLTQALRPVYGMEFVLRYWIVNKNNINKCIFAVFNYTSVFASLALNISLPWEEQLLWRQWMVAIIMPEMFPRITRIESPNWSAG
jgi:hypothetical protein